jgi:hypothetical protein
MCFEAACGWGHGRTLLDQDSLAYLREPSGSQRVRVSLVMAVLEVKRGGADEMMYSLVALGKAKGSIAFIRRGAPKGS